MMVWIWVALLALFIIIEASTAQLLTIWFAVGSLAALVTKGNIENCYSAGGSISVNVGRAYKVNGASDNKSVEAGGLVGNHTGNFTRCYNTSNIYIK